MGFVRGREESGRGRRSMGRRAGLFWPALLALGALAFSSGQARASTAWGSTNNFDVVNDTGSETHGFEIELEDTHSTDITYTYDWNHYGTPKITQDDTDPAHPRVFVRWASAKKPDGTWAAYTAVPAGPIDPTQGHQFTNPAVNFGGEHFGVGYRNIPSAIRYHWMMDNGAGVLILGPLVQVATPTFLYNPPQAGAPAQVQAVIAPPPPEVPDPLEFGPAMWVKEIRTTTHNSEEVRLRDLISKDPDSPERKDWTNGEPDEVEVEWQLLQTDYNSGNGGANGELAGAPEDLNNGDEVITRRYEFYEYTGPIDAESGEAMADNVAADGVHGVGTKRVNGVNVDLSTVAVVGLFLGAQMSAVDAQAGVGLIDHLEDGAVGTPYAARTVVIGGNDPFTATSSGSLPPGMAFDPVTGVLSGTPTASGVYSFTVNAQDAGTPLKTKKYTLTIAEAGVALPQRSVIDTSVSPAGSGTTTGDGAYVNGTIITVVATPRPGFAFAKWLDNGTVVSTAPRYSFNTTVARSLLATFVPAPTLTLSINSPAPANEGTAAAPGSATFVVTLSAPSTKRVTVGYATADGTARAGQDYVGRSGTLSFAPGSTSATITVRFIGDSSDGPAETFTVNLANATNAAIRAGRGVGTITSTNPPPSVSIYDLARAEGNAGTSAFTFTAGLSAPSEYTVTVRYATANGTALAGVDYTAAAGTLTFAPGVTRRTVTVPVRGDALNEASEAFLVNLSAPTHATLGRAQGRGTILNDDPLPALSINDVARAEVSSGATLFTFTVSLSAASGQSVTVRYATANGSATAGTDYIAASGVLTFGPGVTTRPITIAAKADALVEPSEAFLVNLSAPTKATIARGQGTGTITPP